MDEIEHSRASTQVWHATLNIFQRRWRSKEALEALPQSDGPLSEQRCPYVKNIRHHFTRRGTTIGFTPCRPRSIQEF